MNKNRGEIDKDYKFAKNALKTFFAMGVIKLIFFGIMRFKDSNKARKRRILKKWGKRFFYLLLSILLFVALVISGWLY